MSGRPPQAGRKTLRGKATQAVRPQEQATTNWKEGWPAHGRPHQADERGEEKGEVEAAAHEETEVAEAAEDVKDARAKPSGPAETDRVAGGCRRPGHQAGRAPAAGTEGTGLGAGW